MKQLLSDMAYGIHQLLRGVVHAGWERLPPEKAAAVSKFESEWADENYPKWRLEFWRRHSMGLLWPHSWLQVLGTLGVISVGLCAVAILSCFLLIGTVLASLGVITVIAAASFTCTIMATAAFFPFLAIAAVSGVSAAACLTGSVAVICVHAAFQWLGIMSVPPKPGIRTQASGSGSGPSPLGFPDDHQRKPQPQADIEMRPLPHADMPVSDVSADLHLLRQRPTKVFTATSTAAAAAAEVTPRLLFEGDSGKREAPLTFRSSTSWFVADAAAAPRASGTAAAPGPAVAAAEPPVAASGEPPAAASGPPAQTAAAAGVAVPAVPAPACPDAQPGSDTASASHLESSATLHEPSATTAAVSPVSARSTDMDSAAASDSIMSRESWVAQGGPASAASAEPVDHGRSSPLAGTLSAGMLQTGPAVRHRTAKSGGWRTPPPPAASDVSSSGQASVIDIMDQRFMGGI